MSFFAYLPEPAALGVFLLAALALAATPGPDMLYVMSRSLGQGRAAGLVSALGIVGGSAVHALLAAVGLSQLFAYSPLAYDAVRYAGAAYLLYLAWRAIRDRSDFAPSAGQPLARRTVFLQAMLTNLLNPKVAIFYITFLPQFADPSRGSIAGQILLLALLLNLVALMVKGSVALAAGRLGEWLAARPGVQRLQRWLTASILAGLALRLALPERR